MSQQRLDYVKHCSVSQFSYVQAHDDPKLKNTQQARTIDCIYIRPIYNQQGGHYLYNLPTHDYINRQYVTVIPMTTAVIEAVERLAKADGMTSFVLQDKEGIKFYDSTRIAGVDHNQTEEDQYDDIFRDPDYIQKEKYDIKLNVDDEITEQELNNLKKDQEDLNGDEDKSINDDEEKSIQQIPDKEDQDEIPDKEDQDEHYEHYENYEEKHNEEDYLEDDDSSIPVSSKKNDTEQVYSPDEENQDEEIPDRDNQDEENEEILDEEHQEEKEENTVIEDSQGSRRSTRIPKISQRLQTYRESTGKKLQSEEYPIFKDTL